MFIRISRNTLIRQFSLFLLFFPALSANGHTYLGLSLGAGKAKLNNGAPGISYTSGALITDDYPLNNTGSSTFIVSMNGGYEIPEGNKRPAIAFGLGFYATPSGYSFDGRLIETAEGDAGSALYNYSYNVFSSRLMAEVQFTWAFKRILPYITLGAGPSWNRMNGYKEVAITSNGYTALPPFQSDTEVHLAYQVGFGVSTAFNFPNNKVDFLHERVSVGYRYVNLGGTSFGTRGVLYPYPLNTGKLQSNEIYLGFTHLI